MTMGTETNSSETREQQYGVGMLVKHKGEKVMKIFGRYETIDDLGKGYISWADEFERNKINEKLYMLKFGEDGLARVLENLMSEFHDKLIMAKLIARHSRN